MIKHVVMWKFMDDSKEEMNRFLNELTALKGVIPEIVDMEVGTSLKENNTYDAILIAQFKSLEDLRKYKEDSRHVKVSALCKAIRIDRVAIDFEK